MIHVITYDLRKPGRNYAPLYNAIKSLGGWCHPLESVWLIETWRSTSSVFDALTPHIDQNDLLLVTRFSGDYAAQLANEALQWIGTHRNAA